MKLDASYTVEAAFVLPLVFAFLYGTLFLGFYVHDVTVLNQAVFEGAFLGASKTEDAGEEELENYVKAYTEDMLIASGLEYVNAAILEKEIRIDAQGTFQGPFFVEGLLGPKQKKRIYSAKTVEKPKASGYIRKTWVIIEVLKGLWPEDMTE